MESRIRLVFPLAAFSSFSFRVLDPWSIFFHFLICFFLTTTSTVSYIRRLLLSCATSPLYHPLCRSVYICRSIARIRLFINYGTSLLLFIHVSNLVLRCRAAPLHQNVDELICVVIAVGYSIVITLFPKTVTCSRKFVHLLLYVYTKPAASSGKQPIRKTRQDGAVTRWCR